MKYKSLAATTCCVASALTLAAAPTVASAAPVAGATSITSVNISSELNGSSPSSGISLVLLQCLAEKMNGTDTVEKETTAVAAVTAAEEEPVAKKVGEKEKIMVVAQVDDYVNVRKHADADSELVGKLYNNAVGTVLKEKNGWYKIKSGDVTGYVKAEYVVADDKRLLKKVGTRVATVETDGLRVRAKAKPDAKVMTVVGIGEELEILSESKADDGWVKVAIGDDEGYVSADYVAVSTEYEYAESREAELERLAEEQEEREAAERARQEAEAAKAQQSSSQSSASSSSNQSSSSSSNQSSSSGSSSTGSSSSSTSYKAPSGQSGQAVANFACQFVGNPYVYGGSSLTNGADCSGFVMAVYKAFGVSLPHSSSALRSVGRGVSLEEIQPGDIVCYSGHVAIYVGNNTIVHASTRATGIKYTSPVNYRTIVAVRRIF